MTVVATVDVALAMSFRKTYNGKEIFSLEGDSIMSVRIGRITSKFQITIPSEIREAVGAHVGDQVLFHVNEHGEIVMRPLRKSSVDELYGALHRENIPYVPLDEARSATHDDMAHQFIRETEEES